MCGIVGLISKQAGGFYFNDVDIFTSLLQMDSIRGKDSTGVFGVDKEGDIDYIKGNTNGWQFTQCKNYTDWAKKMHDSYRFVVGHNRAATRGSVTPSNAHPFKEDHIILVHNGTIHNQDELNEASEVDSHAIAVQLSKDNAVDALGKINGAFALVWYDQKHRTLNLARNKERPLFVLEYDDFFVISSEIGLPYWLVGRENKKIVDKPILVPTEKIMEIKLDHIDKGFIEIEYEDYSYKPTYTSSIALPAVPFERLTPLHSPLHVVHSNKSLKQGDTVVFKVDDVKHEDGDPMWTFFGFPLFEDSIDENILIRTEVKHSGVADTLKASEFLTGTVTSVGTYGNMPIVHVQFPTAYRVHVDAQENVITQSVVNEALKEGCMRCAKVILMSEISQSILRKKKDGSWRRLCPSCLKESKENKIDNFGNAHVVGGSLVH